MPQIRAAADEIEARRELPRSLFEAMADAGLFHMAIPRAVGGSEIDLPTYVLVIEEIGKADASTGWCLNQGAIFGTYAARMPRAVARTIWVDVPRAVVANTPAATSAGCSMSRVVTRRSSRRYFASSNGRARCIVARLSQITRSPTRHAWR